MDIRHLAGEQDGTDVNTDLFDRQIRAFGMSGQKILSGLRVGIVGVGCTGSAVAEQLARPGLDDFVLVDHDKFSVSNRTRMYGSYAHATDLHKTEIVRENICRISPGAAVATVPENVISQRTLDRLKNCDVVFGCVDAHAPRSVLNETAHQFFIPVIDVGVGIDAKDGRIAGGTVRMTLSGPSLPRLYCTGVIRPETIQAESFSTGDRKSRLREGYIQGAGNDDDAPSVVSLTTMAASYAVLFLKDLLFFYHGIRLQHVAHGHQAPKDLDDIVAGEGRMCVWPGWARGDTCRSWHRRLLLSLQALQHTPPQMRQGWQKGVVSAQSHKQTDGRSGMSRDAFPITVTAELDRSDRKYRYLDAGRVGVTIRNDSTGNIIVERLELRFKYHNRTEKFTKPVNERIQAKQQQKIVFDFEIGPWAACASNLFTVHVLYRKSDALSKRERYSGPSDYILVQKAPLQDEQVFISHSNEQSDQRMVKKVRHRLSALGFTPYVAEHDANSGEVLWGKILDQIESSGTVILLYTENASESGDVHTEIGISLGMRKKIIPVAGTAPPNSLSGIEYVELDTKNIDRCVIRIMANLLRKQG